MPFPPPPYTLVCQKCDWKKTIKPKSDALMLGIDWFQQCPDCGAKDLDERKPTTAELLTLEGGNFLGRLFGRRR